MVMGNTTLLDVLVAEVAKRRIEVILLKAAEVALKDETSKLEKFLSKSFPAAKTPERARPIS